MCVWFAFGLVGKSVPTSTLQLHRRGDISDSHVTLDGLSPLRCTPEPSEVGIKVGVQAKAGY